MDSLVQTFRNLGTVRLVAIAGVALGLIAFFVFLTSRLSNTEMALLYAELDPADSSKIVSQLEAQTIPYELRGDGRSIMVPRERVLRLRMAMAEQGLPSGGSVGYEIFDRSEGLGATNFVQNINLVRALEGELARTIRTLSQVSEARVHLVMPKRELFSRTRQDPSASVVIRTRGSQIMEKSQIQAIQQLVAAAVPGLKPNRLSIVDSRGRLLARSGESDDLGAIASTADELRRLQENRLRMSIEELLEQTVGVGKVRARVAADIDFDRISTSVEKYDPDGQVVRSVQTVEEAATSRDSDANEAVTVSTNLPDGENAASGTSSSNQTTRTEETTNFEISKTTRSHVREIGTIKKLSVAVLVDGRYVENEEGDTVYQPRAEEEIAQLRQLTQTAIGFDQARGDQIEIANLRFVSPGEEISLEPDPLFGLTKNDLFRMGEIFVLAIVGILVILLVVRPLVARTLDALPSAIEAAKEHALLADHSEESQALAGPTGTGVSGQIGDGAEEPESMINLEAVEGRVKASTIRKITEIVESHPEETIGIIRQWMYAE